MNIEKTECDRLGYEYKSLLEQVVYVLHHIPYAKDFINEEGLKKLDDLSLKLSTGDCEIIEFKRTLCKYNFTDILKEKDKEIERLNNIINELENKLLQLRLTDIDGRTIVYRMLDKLKELKDSDNNVKKINTNNN